MEKFRDYFVFLLMLNFNLCESDVRSVTTCYSLEAFIDRLSLTEQTISSH